ncbi:hypothetical protein MMC14_000140 [Varicellaria rhodocarpa]|nr:hypothetical protein [Varicellaria rhodocarpa]
MEDDPFNSLLGLEDEYYNEGFALGTTDGRRAGHVEGRLFGLEKGFEKYSEMGRLHGRSIVWGNRLLHDQRMEDPEQVLTQMVQDPVKASATIRIGPDLSKSTNPNVQTPADRNDSLSLPRLQRHSRIEKHVRTFHALVEPESISTQNNEDDVSEFDDRLKRAYGKLKMIERFMGEESVLMNANGTSSSTGGLSSSTAAGGDSSIEDVSSSQARH